MPAIDLTAKIVKEIKASGYPLGFYVRKTIAQHEWNLGGQRDYVTKEGTHREIDAVAFLQDRYETQQGHGYLSSVLLCECKSSKENPWVFFKDDPAFGKMHNIEVRSLSYSKAFLKDVMDENRKFHLRDPDTISSEWIVALCSNDKKNRQIYDGIENLVGCIDHWRNTPKMEFSDRDLRQFFLALVFEGDLFVAQIEKDDVSVAQTDHVAVKTTRIEQFRSIHYAVDVVKREHFKTYLEELREDHKIVFECLSRINS
jgi:hypothetical protein